MAATGTGGVTRGHPAAWIPPAEAETIPALFRARLARDPEGEAYRGFDPRRGTWVGRSWREMGAEVARWQAALLAEGLASGERVGILLNNRWEWVAVDLAALGLGLVVVPLYANDRPANVAHVLEDAGVRLLVVRDVTAWHTLRPALAGLSQLRRVVWLDDGEEEEQERAAGCEEAAAHPAACPQWAWLPLAGELLAREGDPRELATIIYTSGTTGRSKGVMLSHANLLSNAYGSLLKAPIGPGDLLLSFLPLSHALERTTGYLLPMMAGATVAHARSVSHLAEDLHHVQPTAIISVPRIYERIHARVEEGLARAGIFSQGVFRLAEAVGWRRFLWHRGRAGWHPALLLWPLLDGLVARRLRRRLGGRLRLAVSGGAPIPAAVSRRFLAMGVPLLQGYGLTEAGPVISANTLEANDPASVGTPLEGVAVRIGAHDELQVSGPNVTAGYWRNPAATAAIFTPDHWLRTGDQARMEADGRLFITGRLKDIVVMANGRKVAPGDMESAVALDPLFAQVVVVGEGRPYLSALLVLEPGPWQAFARARGWDPADPAVLASETLEELLLARANGHLELFPGFARLRRLAVTTTPWTVETGLMTPTLKLRRERILTRFQAQVEALYRGH